MQLKINKNALFQLILISGLSGAVYAGSVEGTTHVLGAVKQTLSSTTDTVKAGYYSSTTLHAVDANLAAANIKSGTAIFGITGTLAGGSGHELPDTGVTLCYDTAGGGTITCPEHGAASEQDGSYNPAATQLSYTDNGNFTITDNRTGLMWKKCQEGRNNDATCTGTVGTYTWAAALARCSGLTAPGGYTDWRLPNIKELISLLNYNTAYMINTAYFTNYDYNGVLWSSSALNDSEYNSAWRVNPVWGQTTYIEINMINTNIVLCVCTPP